MRKFTAIVICAALLLCLCNPVFAAEQSGQASTYSSGQVVNGLTIETRIVDITQTRATDVKTYECTQTLREDGEIIAVIVFEATFVYNGVTVGIMSKKVTSVNTYNGWSYQQISFTGANGTVTLTGRLVKGIILTDDFSLSITCDKDGNISSSHS